MDLQTIANGVLAYIVAPGIIVAVAAYLVKQWLEHSLSNSAKKYQAELEKAAFTYQTRFSAYHEKQVEVIGQIYKMLADVEFATSSLPIIVQKTNDQTITDRLNKATDTFNDLIYYYHQHKLYLANSVRIQIEKILDMYRTDLNLYMSTPFIDGEQAAVIWQKVSRDFVQVIPEAKKILDQQLQDLINPNMRRSDEWFTNIPPRGSNEHNQFMVRTHELVSEPCGRPPLGSSG
jgi:hypothetical protein